MALITRSASAHADASTAQVAPQISGDLIAGENLDAVSPCYIAANGKVYMSNGTAANIAAHVDGFVPIAKRTGEPLALYGPGTRFGYGDGLTPGTDLYLGATAGRLDTAATTGGTQVIARVITATDIVVMRKQ